MGFTRTELLRYRGAVVPDLAGPDMRLLFVGINPGLWAAASRVHFARPGNRFYPALAEAGITDYLIRAGEEMADADRNHLISRGVGITNVVSRATARADELGIEELQYGASRLAAKVALLEPAVVAVAGITAYRLGFERRKASFGQQPEGIAGAALWVVPNPSGLNAHETITSLAAAYREPASAAGLVLSESG